MANIYIICMDCIKAWSLQNQALKPDNLLGAKYRQSRTE